MSTSNRVLGGALLVAGTSVGAGMLTLPLVTAQMGYYLSFIAFLICWLVMLSTAFFMTEVSLWFKHETNIVSMVQGTLGKHAKTLVWFVYLLFLYALMSLYISTGAAAVDRLFSIFIMELPEIVSILIYVIVFAGVVYYGATAVDSFNRYLVLFLVASYFLLVFLITPEVKLEHINWGSSDKLLYAVPTIVMSFGFHLLIPSLRDYMRGDGLQIKKAVLLGSVIPLIVYLIWEYVILGTVPLGGEQGLIAISSAVNPITDLTSALAVLLNNKLTYSLIEFFTFFAVVSSFVGVSIGLFDFLSDGLRGRLQSRLGVLTITFLPPTLFLFLFPGRFMLVLEFAGILSAILLIIYPAWMFLQGHKRYAAGGVSIFSKIVATISLLFGLGIIFLDIYCRF